MQLWTQIICEVGFRKLNAFFSVLGLTLAVIIVVASQLIAESDERETRRVTRDMGFNLRLIPAETDLGQFYRDGFSRFAMDATTLDRLATQLTNNVSFNHLVGSLRRGYTINGQSILLVGLSKTYVAPGQGKKPMGFVIKTNTIHIGSEIARVQVKNKGDTMQVGMQQFQISNDPIETGTSDDITIFARLEDVQSILGLSGKINEIEAIDCLCLTADEDPLAILRKEIGDILPDVQVVHKQKLADARAKQRQTREKVNAVVLPSVLLASAVWVALLAVFNVRDRRQEIGILRALGKSGWRIAGLFLGKAVLLGFVAAGFGVVFGMWAVLEFGPSLFPVTKKAIQVNPLLAFQLVFATPLFAAFASFIPAMLAVSHDPAETLRED
ncbi:MAG: FtsX-like permease family protein [Verrucomicrobiota bacterium]|jgi:ABC-type lipoprotein release transport system permease subunit|nr:FtsX-like permease family protein [Verrucomicrobiota bacterium]